MSHASHLMHPSLHDRAQRQQRVNAMSLPSCVLLRHPLMSRRFVGTLALSLCGHVQFR